MLTRDEVVERLDGETRPWDILVVGGGAAGLGCAVDAASRGYSTLLLEQSDFAKGTSSRSTKLVHGGVRYLRQGNIPLVKEALRERGLLMRNAPHLVHDRRFVVPNYEKWKDVFYSAGLKVYDMLAGKFGLGPSGIITREQTLNEVPNILEEGLRDGIVYYDGQFDDSRLAISLAQTVFDMGGFAVNYMRVVALLKRNSAVSGVIALDEESGEEHRIRARAIINATGVFTDQFIKLDNPGAAPLTEASQGIHVVLDRKFLRGDSALMVPRTEDGRVLFAVPWYGRVLVGTTDTPMREVSLEPAPLEEEVEFILLHAAKYLSEKPDASDLKSVFAGLRPLVRPAGNKRTASISREHVVSVSRSGLVTIAGGKWTTYRKMGEDTVDFALKVAHLPRRKSLTAQLRIHGWMSEVDRSSHMCVYGSDFPEISGLIRDDPHLGARLHPELPYLKGEVVFHARREMARSVEDVLARRTRALLLDAKASLESAPGVARLLAGELRRDDKWEADQVARFANLARNYLRS